MSLVSCPTCGESVRLPVGSLPPDGTARCPWCGDSRAMADWLHALPPVLEVFTADGKPFSGDPEPQAVTAEAEADTSTGEPESLATNIAPPGEPAVDLDAPLGHDESPNSGIRAGELDEARDAAYFSGVDAPDLAVGSGNEPPQSVEPPRPIEHTQPDPYDTAEDVEPVSSSTDGGLLIDESDTAEESTPLQLEIPDEPGRSADESDRGSHALEQDSVEQETAEEDALGQEALQWSEDATIPDVSESLESELLEEATEEEAAADGSDEEESIEDASAEEESAEVESASEEPVAVASAEFELPEVESAELESAELESAEVESAEVESAEVESAQASKQAEANADASSEGSDDAEPQASESETKRNELIADDEAYYARHDWERTSPSANRLKFILPTLIAIPVLIAIAVFAGVDFGIFPFDGSLSLSSGKSKVAEADTDSFDTPSPDPARDLSRSNTPPAPEREAPRPERLSTEAPDEDEEPAVINPVSARDEEPETEQDAGGASRIRDTPTIEEIIAKVNKESGDAEDGEPDWLSEAVERIAGGEEASADVGAETQGPGEGDESSEEASAAALLADTPPAEPQPSPVEKLLQSGPPQESNEQKVAREARNLKNSLLVFPKEAPIVQKVPEAATISGTPEPGFDIEQPKPETNEIAGADVSAASAVEELDAPDKVVAVPAVEGPAEMPTPDEVPAEQESPEKLAPQIATDSAVTVDSPELVAACQKARSTLSKLQTLRDQDKVTDRILAFAYSHVAGVGAVAVESDAVSEFLDDLIDSDTLGLLEPHAGEWIRYPGRKSDGVVLVGTFKLSDGRPWLELADESRCDVDFERSLALSPGTRYVALGRIKSIQGTPLVQLVAAKSVP